MQLYEEHFFLCRESPTKFHLRRLWLQSRRKFIPSQWFLSVNESPDIFTSVSSAKTDSSDNFSSSDERSESYSGPGSGSTKRTNFLNQALRLVLLLQQAFQKQALPAKIVTREKSMSYTKVTFFVSMPSDRASHTVPIVFSHKNLVFFIPGECFHFLPHELLHQVFFRITFWKLPIKMTNPKLIK